ncbi:MAG: M42 family peptidase [Armatimonadetes bacterium]|nr:M42 family peptidase [Armatimonadota bacterium]
MTREDTLELLTAFCRAHSPTGHEDEIDPLVIAEFERRGYQPTIDSAGNIYVIRPGRGQGRIIITAHKDEIGVIVKRIDHDGRLQVRPVGGALPWVYGEGPMDVLGDDAVVPGILSFGSRHTSAETSGFSARTAPLTWDMAWIDTLRSPAALDDMGVHIGSKAVVARSRKTPVVIGNYVASYALDDKAAMVVLFDLLDQVAEVETNAELVFAVTSEEEIGVVGASWLAARLPADVMLAIEVGPVANEYHTIGDDRPVILMQDSQNLYDERVARELTTAAANLEMGVQYACLASFGSDASISAKYGHTARPACVAFATENTHGFEIAHFGGLLNCARLIAEYLRQFG